MSAPAPPQSIQAEREVIGTLLVFYKPQLVHVAQSAGLTPQDFYRQTHEAIYRAILKMHGGGEHVDTLTVSRFLSTQPDEHYGTWLTRIGGPAQIEYLACFTSVTGFRERCAIVHEDGRWRRWLRALYEALDCVERRDEEAFWSAVGRVREDVLGSELRVIDGERAA